MDYKPLIEKNGIWQDMDINAGDTIPSALIPKSPQIMGCDFASTTQAASTTLFFQLFGSLTAGGASTEAQKLVTIPIAGVFSNLVVKTSAAQPAGGDLIFALRVNGGNSLLGLTIPAGSAAGTYTNNTLVQVGALSDVCMRVQNTSTAASATRRSFSVTFTPSALSPVNSLFDQPVTLKNSTVPTSNPPVGQMYFYLENGILKTRGSSGTITSLANP